MTREEAREILTHNWTRVDNPNYSESELDEAFFMAIEALANLKSEFESADAVSREEYDFKKNLERFNEGILSASKKLEDKGLFKRVDFVEVVRCKDCRWWQDDCMGTSCSRLSGVRFTNADDFCSHGERREP